MKLLTEREVICREFPASTVIALLTLTSVEVNLACTVLKVHEFKMISQLVVVKYPKE